ncbi:MAG: N-acetylmuramoyl-L-alanine amidase [Lachnospiraceae bacterium]|nr:N-acetylmuramoyl-L-alanine amidase [Lachnospiraceae bacterium]
MAENRIKKVRQYCVSVMVLCLAMFGVYTVQEKTGWQNVNAEASEDQEERVETSGQLIVLGDAEAVTGGHADTEVEDSAWSQIFGTEIPELAKKQGNSCVLIKKNGTELDTIFEEMVYRKITVSLKGSVTKEDVLRVSGNALYTGEPVVEEVFIPEELKNVPLVREPKKTDEDSLLSLAIEEKGDLTRVMLEFNSVYEVTVTEDEEFYYLSLVRPHEKYDHIVVIDPGHGGIDTGTSGGGFYESHINLAVVKYLKELLDEQENWKVYYTRLNNTLPDLSTRVEFANALHADMLVSVHCNHNPVSAVNGVEVLYSKVQGAEDAFNSKVLAEICSAYVSEATGLKERPLVDRSTNLHIIKYCNMPMALIEFGYMSNRKDLSIITTEEAQRACAEAIYRSIETAFEKAEQ